MRLLFGLLTLAAAGALASCGSSGNGGSVTIVPGDSDTPVPGETPAPTADGETPGPTTPGDPTANSGDVTTLPCGDILAPVNKQNALPPDCEPVELVTLPEAYSWGSGQALTPEATDALIELLDAAIDDGFDMYAASTYRSYQQQANTFQFWVERDGLEEAERQSARPGHSEHQLGTTADLTVARNGADLDSFRGTPEAEWVAKNAWRFGYIVSYPPDSESITGYLWEPWHIRYVGRDVARAVHESGLTLGEYLLQR